MAGGCSPGACHGPKYQGLDPLIGQIVDDLGALVDLARKRDERRRADRRRGSTSAVVAPP
jgi:hypothetical protein